MGLENLFGGHFVANGNLRITVGGKTFREDYLGIKIGDWVRIDRWARRVTKSSDEGETWSIVDCPEHYGCPSINITNV